MRISIQRVRSHEDFNPEGSVHEGSVHEGPMRVDSMRV